MEEVDGLVAQVIIFQKGVWYVIESRRDSIVLSPVKDVFSLEEDPSQT